MAFAKAVAELVDAGRAFVQYVQQKLRRMSANKVAALPPANAAGIRKVRRSPHR
jgi:hypothetical protein